MSSLSFTCAVCGEAHEGLPDVAFDSPIYYHQLSPEDRRRFALLTSDWCSIRDEDFFIRTCLPVPIIDRDRTFMWGVWVSVSRPNFERYLRFFNEDPPEGEGPWFGWFSNRIPGYPDTINLKTHVHLQPRGARPILELEPTDHPLSVHSREGLPLDDLVRLVDPWLHPDTEG